MIKQIIFKKTNSLIPEELLINFDEKINIIIGPKGGGKSTLFDLLASIKVGYIPKNVIDALKDFGLEFGKAVKFNNEVINFNQLSKKTKKEMLLDFGNRDDVIFQDDPIKKNINNLTEIEKQKTEYIQTLINKSPIISELIEKIRVFYNDMETISIMNNKSEINWSNAFQIKTKNDNKTRLIINLSYKDTEINSKLRNELRDIKEVIENSENQIIELNKMQNKSFINIYNDDKFNNDYLKNINNLIKEHKDFLILLQKRMVFINKIKLMIISFDIAYKNVIENIKKVDFAGEGLKAYEKQAQDYFKNFAQVICKQKSSFEELINQEIVLDFKDEIINTSLLSYKIDSIVKLNLEQIISILKVVLHTPTSVSDISKWLLELIKKGLKDFNVEKISNNIAKMLKEYVKVFAEGKDYDTMSLGQKSIYGIKYKFNSSIDKILFLDQPEDNLDNYTIATSILNLLAKKEKQVFIVTHNANIGILSNPQKIIVADLNNKQQQYYEANLKDINNNELSSTHYLEGGIEFLERRYKKIKGEK